MTDRKRKWLKLAAAAALGVLTLAALLPVWLPWVLRPWLAAQGVGFGGYERHGYARCTLRDVRWRSADADFSARWVNAALPLAWLASGSSGQARPRLEISDWQLTFDPSAADDSDGSLPALLSDIRSLAPPLNRWLPLAVATNGVVNAGTNAVLIPFASWRTNTLDAELSWPPLAPDAQLRLAVSPETPGGPTLELDVTVPVRQLTLRAQAVPSATGEVIDGSIQWQTNRAEVTAMFDRAGWRPETATLRSGSVELSGTTLGLDGYSSVRGGFEAHWRSNRWSLELTARGEPATTNSAWPALDARLAASGDTRTARLDSARFATAWLTAELAQPMEGGFAVESWQARPVVSKITADLSQTPWSFSTVPLAGRVAGEVVLIFSDQLPPSASFALASDRLYVAGLAATNVQARGALRWPLLQLEEFTTGLEQGPRITARGEVDAQRGVVVFGNVEAAGRLAESAGGAGWRADSLTLTARVSGPFARLTHAGRLAADGLRNSNFPPAQLSADWRGESLNFEDARLRVQSGAWSLAVGGSLTASGNNRTLAIQLNEASLARSNAPLAGLVSPGVFIVGRATEADGWIVRAQDLHWNGPAGELRLDGETSGPRAGQLRLSAKTVGLKPWLEQTARWRDAQLEHAELTAAWENGPVEFEFSARARAEKDASLALGAELRVSGGRDGIRIEQARVLEGNEAALTMAGRVPVIVEPGRGKSWWQAIPGAEMDLQVSAGRGAQFWDALGAWTGVTLREPSGQAFITGTPARPQGRLELRATAAAFPEARRPLPTFERLRAVAEFSSTNAALTEFSAEIEGQPVVASAEVPLAPELWTDPRRRIHWPALEHASARVRVEAASVAAFARFLPDILSPQGTVSADVAVRPGLTLAGSLSLSNAATRGLLPMGPVRDVQARFRFVDRRAEVEQFSGRLAGETVEVTGHLTWPRLGEPELAVRLRGQRVPLARQPGLILRADVDLALTSSNAAPPLLTGTLRLRDSFYLAELRSLLPGRAASAQRRPPFFSVTEEPFADWRIDVKVSGERGLRVRTPLFRGELSPDLRLGGTLREPFAVGEIRVAEGRVTFPFASINIEQGRVALAAANPYRPELFVAGSARAFDYDLRLHVTGFADAPVWEMSSNPPLTPEAIVLLVTAGEVPRDAINFSERQRAGRLMFFLGKSLFSELWLEDSAADRLTIRSGESVTRDGRETYAVEYQLSDRWSLVGEYDQFNDLNAGIKWRVYSK